MHNSLTNAELIEAIAYSHDNEAQSHSSPLASILTEHLSGDSDTNSESGSDVDSDSDLGVVRDAALKVGPIVAVTGLNMEEAGFRKSSWFVDLEEEEEGEGQGKGPGNTASREVSGYIGDGCGLV